LCIKPGVPENITRFPKGKLRLSPSLLECHSGQAPYKPIDDGEAYLIGGNVFPQYSAAICESFIGENSARAKAGRIQYSGSSYSGFARKIECDSWRTIPWADL
jgi:hypothetical protein